MTPARPCHYCRETSVVLCDGTLVGETGRGLHGYPTCSRPLCERHRIRVGHVRVGGRRDGRRGDSIDHCPECRAGGGRRRASEAELPHRQPTLFDL